MTHLPDPQVHLHNLALLPLRRMHRRVAVTQTHHHPAPAGHRPPPQYLHLGPHAHPGAPCLAPTPAPHWGCAKADETVARVAGNGLAAATGAGAATAAASPSLLAAFPHAALLSRSAAPAPANTALPP
eukprot:scaffold7731_cov90-Isochrysis_galbana.AAC.1